MKNQISYTDLLDHYNVSRHKCKCCGGDIVYSNTTATVKNNSVKIKGKNYNTQKVVDGTIYKLQVCEQCLTERFPNITNLSRIFNVMSEPTKFAFDIPDDAYYKNRKRYAMTLETMIKKYGKKEGQKRWDTYCKRQSETNTFEYKQKTYGWTKEQFDEYNASRAVTKSNLIKRYGTEKGLDIWEKYVERQKITKSWDYMVKKYGVEKAREINRSKVLCLENFVRKYGQEHGEIKYKAYLSNTNSGVSQISQLLFKNLDRYLGQQFETYYHSKNFEYIVEKEHGTYLLDYYIKDLKICIEYNGSCYHGDERVYSDEDCPNPFLPNATAKQLREADKERYLYLFKKYGIKTYIIWELDFNPKTFDYKDFIENILNINI